MSQTKTNGKTAQVAIPPPDYIKKIVNTGDSCPLSETYTREQINRRIAFYEELNRVRDQLPREKNSAQKKFALYGWRNISTIRVYMREKVSRMAKELFFSDYSISVKNVYITMSAGNTDKDRGYVVVVLKATIAEIEALMNYIKPGSSYFVYDGEFSKYVPGKTEDSEFIITKVKDQKQPKKFWRRSQSFIAGIKEFM